MGQTLTHGIYLPDEGERNCYNGLAANWQLLDGAVGTVAEHTTALAGKAPLVHTHTKADITDLLNSNFIPSANNSYDLGSSSYQWNNLYAKNYYYNGVAWGLDKYNQWTGVNDFNNLIGLNNAELWFKHQNIEDITTNPSVDTAKSILQVWNKATTQYFGGIIDGLDTSGTHVFEIVNFGYPLNSTNAYQHRFRFASKRDGTASFYPTYSNVDLGTSTNKWKTLNGINPGALSLPNYSKSMNVDTTGWSTSAGRISYTPTINGWLQIAIPNDIDNNNEKSNFITIMDTDVPNDGFNNPSGISAGDTNDYRIQITFPVVANKTYYIYIKSYSGNILAVKYIAALGHI